MPSSLDSERPEPSESGVVYLRGLWPAIAGACLRAASLPRGRFRPLCPLVSPAAEIVIRLNATNASPPDYLSGLHPLFLQFS